MKILYFTSNPLPSKRANRTQVIKMCEAFSYFAEVFLILEKIKGDIFKEYNLKRQFNTLELGYCGRLKCLVYTWKLRNLLKQIQPDFIFIRDNYLLFSYNLFKKFGLIKESPKLITEIQGIYALNFISRKITNLNTRISRIKFFKKTQLPRLIDKIYQLISNNFITYFFEKFNLTQVDFFIFLTKYLKDYYLKKYSLNINNTIVLPNGIDLDLFKLDLTKQQIRNKLNLSQTKKIIGWVGNFKEQKKDKGLLNIFEAARLLNNPNYLFMIIGGDKRDVVEYQNLAKQMGVEQQIKFIGHINFFQVPIYLKSLDLVLMPFSWTKHYAYNMCPRKLFDYLASGVPLVSSDLPSLRTVLNDRNCVFCEPGDAKDLAEKIDYLLVYPKLAKKIAEQAYQDIQEYTWHKRVKKIIKLILS